MEYVTTGLLWYVAFLFSTVLHEASHAFLAYRLGDRTAYDGGQVTLDPFPHMKREPIGTIVIPILSYAIGGWMIGWASVPYNFEWALTYPKRSAVMSLGGPAANLILVLLGAIAIRVGIVFGFFVPPDSINYTRVVVAASDGVMTTVASFVNVFFSLNLLLFMFNLLPIPPLDGSGLAPLFLKTESARKYLLFIRNPAFAFMGLFLAWKVFGSLYGPIHLACVNAVYFAKAHYGG
jgi:Zn-dependent protease